MYVFIIFLKFNLYFNLTFYFQANIFLFVFKTGGKHQDFDDLNTNCTLAGDCKINEVCGEYGGQPNCGQVRRNRAIENSDEQLGQWCAFNNYMQNCTFICDYAKTKKECEAFMDPGYNCEWTKGALPFDRMFEILI